MLKEAEVRPVEQCCVGGSGKWQSTSPEAAFGIQVSRKLSEGTGSGGLEARPKTKGEREERRFKRV